MSPSPPPPNPPQWTPGAPRPPHPPAPIGGQPQQPGPFPPPPPPYPPAPEQGPPHPGPPPAWQPPQPPPPRRGRALPVVLAVVAGVVVLAVAITVPLALRDDDDAATHESGQPAGSNGADADLGAVRVYDDLDPTHRTGDIEYPTAPPVGGPHHPQWLECGVYDTQVNAENLVHDLEHGTVVITYREDAVDADGVERLAARLPANGILTPWAEQSADVVITVWGRQLELAGPDDPRIPLFVDAFGAGETAPEPFASCAGGLTDPQGSGASDGRSA